MILVPDECGYIYLRKYGNGDDTLSFSEFILKIVDEEIIGKKIDRK